MYKSAQYCRQMFFMKHTRSNIVFSRTVAIRAFQYFRLHKNRLYKLLKYVRKISNWYIRTLESLTYFNLSKPDLSYPNITDYQAECCRSISRINTI